MQKPYKKLYISSAISFVIMFGVMYLNAYEANHIYANLNRAYMTVLMVAPMVLLKLFFMSSMFKNKAHNTGIIAGATLMFVLALFLLRTQTFIGNKQFLMSMIPHHSSAILVCENANITDEETQVLCGEIIKAQKEEIAQMKQILERLSTN